MNEDRLGKFTSSSIYELTKFAKNKKDPSVSFYSYIDEKVFEMQSGRRLSDSQAKPTSWGNYMEKHVFDAMPKYKGLSLVSKEFVIYKDPEFHGLYGGTPDLIGETKVGDIKCPWTIKSYLYAYNCIDIQELRDKHPDGDKYYWQLVSNSILTDKPKCDLFFWIPRGYALDELGESEPEIVRIHEQMKHSADPTVSWSVWADTEEFPYLLNQSTLQFKHFEFEPPEEDKAFLLERVHSAIQIFRERVKV